MVVLPSFIRVAATKIRLVSLFVGLVRSVSVLGRTFDLVGLVGSLFSIDLGQQYFTVGGLSTDDYGGRKDIVGTGSS